MASLLALLKADLQNHIDRVKASGAVAPADTWLSPNGRYIRVRSGQPLFDGKKTMGLGRIGSEDHRDWQQRIQRRNALEELERRSREVERWLMEPIWDLR